MSCHIYVIPSSLFPYVHFLLPPLPFPPPLPPHFFRLKGQYNKYIDRLTVEWLVLQMPKTSAGQEISKT